VGPLAAWGIAEGDWTSVWQARNRRFIFRLPRRWDSSCAAAAIATGIDADGARGDLPRDSGGSIDAVDGEVAGPRAIDGKPRS